MIVFHYTYLLMALGFVLTGYYSNLIVFTSLILIHELGHYSMAKFLNFNPSKIIIYPYGGITKLNDLINKNINKELLIAVSGVFVQLLYFYFIIFLYRQGYVREYTINLFNEYNKQIILFNLLPIYPLDGSKIVNLLLAKIFNYDMSNKLTIVISVITMVFIIILDIYSCNYSNIMIITVLVSYLYKFYKKLRYLYNKFLLERYLYNIKYDKVSIIGSRHKLYKNRTHIIKKDNIYLKENSYLKDYFNKKYYSK